MNQRLVLATEHYDTVFQVITADVGTKEWQGVAMEHEIIEHSDPINKAHNHR